jgi:Rhs element Vgr protein
MSISPLHSKNDIPSFQILVEGEEISGEYQVVSIFIEKEIGRVCKAKVTLSDGDAAKETFALSESSEFNPGKKIKIKLGYHSDERDAFEGVITSHSIKVKSYGDRGYSQMVLTCHDKAFQMSLVRKSINFSEKKDSEVLTTLIGNHGVGKTVQSTAYKHKNLIQHNCSDWDFLLSRAEANGFIVINDKGKLDVAKPKLSESEKMNLNFGKDIYSFDGEIDTKTQYKSVAFHAWDGTSLKLTDGKSMEPSMNSQGDFTGKKMASESGDQVLELSTSAPEDPSLLKAFANAHLQRSRLSRIKGNVSYPGSLAAAPGDLIKLEGFGTKFNGAAFVTRIQHEFEKGTWKTEAGFGLEKKTFLDGEEPSGSDALGLLPSISGIHIGVVKKIDKDPDGESRVLVDLPIVEASGKGVWARLTTPYASEGVGMYFYPEVGDEVTLGFLNNDPRFAVILGSLYGKKMKPPFTPNSKNSDKGFVTKSKMKVVFDEDKKIITIETPAKQKVVVDDDDGSILLNDKNGNKLILDSGGITLKSGKDITIDAGGNVKIKSTGKTDIKATSDASIAGNNVSAKGNISFKAEGAASTEVKSSGTLTLKGTMVMIN